MTIKAPSPDKPDGSATRLGRRQFLLAGSMLASAAALPAAASPAPEATAGDERARFAETDHVRTYYARARF